MVAHLEFIATWECSAHIGIIVVVVSSEIFPDTSLNVANGVLLGLWLLATGPKIGFIEPCELNPVAFPANRVVELLRDSFGTALGIVEAILRAFEHALLNITVTVKVFYAEAIVLFDVVITGAVVVITLAVVVITVAVVLFSLFFFLYLQLNCGSAANNHS